MRHNSENLAEPFEYAHGTLWFRGTPVEKHWGTQMTLITFSAKTGHFANCEDFHGDFVGNLINQLTEWRSIAESQTVQLKQSKIKAKNN